MQNIFTFLLRFTMTKVREKQIKILKIKIYQAKKGTQHTEHSSLSLMIICNYP